MTTTPTVPSNGELTGVAPHGVVADTDVTSVEDKRIELLVRRDGKAAAQAWVERTLKIYRRALTDDTAYVSLPQYRTQFEDSIRAFESWLGKANPSDNIGRTSGNPVVAREHPCLEDTR